MRTALVSLASLGLLLSAVPAFAHGSNPLLAQAGAPVPPVEAVETGGYASEAIFLGAEILNLVLVGLAIVILALVIGRHGASELSTIFAHFMLGTALLGASRLFILISDTGVIQLADEATHMGWHFILYLAMLSFIFGARGLVHLATSGESKVSTKELGIWGVICGLLTLGLFVSGKSFETFYVPLVRDTWWESFGAIHFIAFLLSGIAAFYVFQRTKVGHITKVIASPMLIALGLVALQHLWELTTESWVLITLDSNTIEQVELIFVIPSFIALTYAFTRLWKVSGNA